MSLFKRSRLRWFGFWLGIGWGWIVVVWYLSLTSTPLDIDLGTSFNDKIGHAIAYAWLMLWFGNLYTCQYVRIGYGLIFIGMGVLLEILQGTMADVRQFSYEDMLANTIGVGIGFLLSLGKSALLLKKLETLYLQAHD